MSIHFATFTNILNHDNTYERGNPGQSKVCYMFLWNSTKHEELDLPSLYLIPKLYKCPYKPRYIAGSAKCSTKPLSSLLTFILSAVKTGLHSYCETSYSRDRVNQMWILKNSKKICQRTYNLGPSPPAISLNIWLIYPLHNYSPF